jgi:hypothetical protein
MDRYRIGDAGDLEGRGGLQGAASDSAVFAPGGTWFWLRGLVLVAALGVVTGAGNIALAI